MNVVLACEIFPPDVGGPVTYAVQLAEALQKTGHKVRVVSYGEIKKEYSYSVVLVSRKIPFLLRQFVYFLKLLRISRRADLIYAQGPSVGPAAVWVRRLRGYQKNHDSAVVAEATIAKSARGKNDTLRQEDSQSQKKVSVVVKFVGDQGWQQIRVKGSRVGFEEYMREYGKRWYDFKTFWIQRWQKFSMSNADHVVVPSQYLKKIVTEYLGVDEKRVVVIPNGVEVHNEPLRHASAFAEASADKRNDDFKNILFVGRFENWKGLDTLIDALKMLPRDFTLTLVGDGSEKGNLELRVTRYALRDRVRFVGRIPHSELENYFSRAFCFVEGTQYEGMPHVVLESWSFGVPVIVSDFPANTELVSDGETGLVFKLGDAKDLADKILKLASDQSLRAHISRTAFEEHKKYDKNKIMNQTIRFLEKLVVSSK